MRWFVVALCFLAVLGIGLLAFSWMLLKKVFGRGPLRPNPGANAKEIQGAVSQIHQALGETAVWIEAHRPEKLELRARDGTVLRAWLLCAEKPTKHFVVGVHGYKSSKLSDIALAAPFYHDQGKNLLLVDDRAHGESEGKYTGFGWLDRLDVLDWCTYLVRRFGPETAILLHGVSMGAAAVCCAAGEAALPPQVLGVVSDCGYSDAWREVRHAAKTVVHIPCFPFLYIVNMYLRLFAHYDLRECQVVRQVEKAKVPFLFIHGGKDRFVPTEMVRELYAACKTDKTLFIVPQAVHALSWLEDSAGCKAQIQRFMERLGF